MAAPASAAADDPAAAPPPAQAKADPRDLFGFDRKPRKPPPGCAEATKLACPRRDGAAPAAVETYLTRAYLRRLPLADADVGAAAALALGATRDGAGLAWSGASSLDNRWFLDGAPVDAPRFGDLTTEIPIGFLAGLRIRTAGFSARDGAALGATIDAELREGGDHHGGEARVWLGAGRSPSAAERARDLYQPFTARYADLRTLSALAVVDGPLPSIAGAQAWYVLGVAPRLTDQGLERRAFRRVDADGDGVADRDRGGALVHEELAAQHRDGLAYALPVLVRLGLRGAHQELALTGLAHLGRGVRWQGAAEAAAAGVDQDSRNLDLIATWRGRWDATTLRAQAAWHRAARRESPRAAGGEAMAIGTAYVPPPDPAAGDAIDRAIRLGCDDSAGGADPYPQLANCPLATGFYATGGAGLLADVVQDRPAVGADVEHRLGEHLLGAGVSGEDARVVIDQRYTGGSLRQQLAPDLYLDSEFVDDARTTYRTRTAAAYLTDTWRPAPAIAVEYGVRGQSTQLGTALVLREILPRVGAAWDFLGRGRSRAFVGWGRYAQVLPAGIGERVLAGPAVRQTLTLGGDEQTSLTGRGAVPIDGGARGTRVDEALAGVEVGLPDVIRLGVSVRARHLGRALEDEAGALTAAGARGGVAATREYREVATWLEGAPTAELGLRVGYAWSRLRGNYPGPYDPIEGYTLGTSTLFDDGDDGNATGALPTDQPHRFFAELALRGRWRGYALEGGLRASVGSGRPRDVRVGGDQVFAIPRGAAGRLPAIATANLHLAARRGRLQATLDLFNLFDRRAPTAIDDRYADDVRPIAGGDRGDLIWLKDAFDDGAAHVNPGYGRVTRYQAPLAALLGVAVDL